MSQHLPRDRPWALEHVGGREPEKLNALVEEKVLPPVVADEVVAMLLPVVLDRQPRPLVPEIDAPQSEPVLIADPVLHLRSGTSGLNQHHPEDRLHQRLGRGLRQLDDALRLSNARPASTCFNVGIELALIQLSAVQDGVDSATASASGR